MLFEITANFINLPPERIDTAIEDAQQQICELCDLDRASLYQWSLEDQGVIELTHLYQSEHSPTPLEKTPDTGKQSEVSWIHQQDAHPPIYLRLNAAEMFPWVIGKLKNNETTCISRMEDLPEEASHDREMFRRYASKSSLIIPLNAGGRQIGAITFASIRHETIWSERLTRYMQRISQTFAIVIERKQKEEQLLKRSQETERLKQQLEQENSILKDEIKVLQQYSGIIGQSTLLNEVLAKVEQVAPLNSTVLITGETGTGKELIAHAIHNHSPRSTKLMVKVNCASLPSSLVENELFGRERGAYTGALTKQIGRFELADGSTLFLDEISEMSLELQAKLLRVLQSGEFERLGSPRTIKVDVRIIAATNRNLLEEVKLGRFREDLFYRLNVFPLHVPPLRERMEDVPMLVWEFVREFNEKMGKKIRRITEKNIKLLQFYAWPGNIRELKNVIEYAVIVSTGDELTVKLPENGSNDSSPRVSLEEIERRHIEDILRQTGWCIKGDRGAALILGLNPSTLYSRMKKLGIPLQRSKIGVPL